VDSRDRTAALRLAALEQQARRQIAGLPDRERAMMLMRGTFGGSRPRMLVEVARTFGVTRTEVRWVECRLFRMLGDGWLAEWRDAREAARYNRRAPADRINDFDYMGPFGLRARIVARPRERRGGCTNVRHRGSRRARV
jgi:hypothetical protein